MSGGTPIQVLHAAEEAEKLYQADIDALMATGPTGEAAEEKPVAEEAAEKVAEKEEVPEEETLEQKLEKSEHRYSVLQGKYNKEVPDLATRLSDQAVLIKRLQDQVAAVKPPEAENVKAKDLLAEVADDPNVKYLREEYPEVYKGLEAVAKKIGESADKKIEALTAQVEETKTHTKKTDSDRFYEDLDKVEGWRDVNKSAEFNEYLDQVEPLTGFKRRAILTDAYNSLDSSRVKNFFSDFKGNEKPVNEVVIAPAPELKGLAPKTTGTRRVADKTENKEKLVKGSEIKKFYEDVRKGLYNGRDKERATEEARLDRAVAESRVLVGQ